MTHRLTSVALFAIALAGGALPCAQAQQDAEPAPRLSERATLGGSWGGLRTAWEARGIEAGLVVTQDVVAVTGGGLDRRTVAPGLIEPTLGFDVDRLVGWTNTRAFLRGIGTYGRDPGEATGSLNAPSNLANAVSTFRLLEGWVERSFLDERLSVRAGLYAADAEFDVKETAGVFMNGGFGTGVDLSQSGGNGPCIFPTSCLGVRVRFQPTPATYVQAAVLDGVAGDPGNPRGTRIRVARDEGALMLGEVGVQRGADEGRFVRAALGVWRYTARFDDLLAVDAGGAPLRRRGTHGVYALLEGELYREPGRPTQGLSGFARIGWADPRVNPVRTYASAGLAYTGLLPGRDEDVAAFGVSVPMLGSTYRAAQRLAGTPLDARETALEAAYRMQLAPWLALQFDAQYIANPGADPALANARVLGLRCQVTF